VEVAPDPLPLGVRRLDHALARRLEGGGLPAPLELGGRARGEDAQRGDVVVVGLHRPGVEHGHMPEVRPVRGAQADREVALEAHLDRRYVLGKVFRERFRERDERVLDRQCAGLALGVVFDRLVPVDAVVPRCEDPHMCAVGLGGLGDEHELGAEGLGDVAHETAQELVADRAGGALGDRPQKVAAAKARSGIVNSDGHRHKRW
jgi:hypothetical protein